MKFDLCKKVLKNDKQQLEEEILELKNQIKELG